MSGAERMGLRESLRIVRLVAAREVGAIFDSGIAVLTTIGFALLANSIFMNEFFLTGTVDMSGYFDLLPLLLSFFLPAISMRLWAEERRQRTVELLLTLPLRPVHAVLGKYAAGLVHYALFLLCSLPIPVMLFVLGDPDPGLVVSGYLGLALFGALFLALGSLVSALSRDQVVAFVAGTLLCFVLVLTGEERVVAVLDGLVPGLGAGSFLEATISALPPYRELVRGVVPLSALVYFAGLSAVGLWSSALVLEHGRA